MMKSSEAIGCPACGASALRAQKMRGLRTGLLYELFGRLSRIAGANDVVSTYTSMECVA